MGFPRRDCKSQKYRHKKHLRIEWGSSPEFNTDSCCNLAILKGWNHSDRHTKPFMRWIDNIVADVTIMIAQDRKQ